MIVEVDVDSRGGDTGDTETWFGGNFVVWNLKFSQPSIGDVLNYLLLMGSDIVEIDVVFAVVLADCVVFDGYFEPCCLEIKLLFWETPYYEMSN